MERQEVSSVPRTFRTPEEEFAYLAKRVERTQETFSKEGVPVSKQEAAEAVVSAHRSSVPAEVLVASEQEAEGIHLPLTPEVHDEKMSDLIGTLLEKGAWKAIAQAEATKNAHLVDDFHRVLTSYLAEGYGAKGLAQGSTLYRMLSLCLYEITVPQEASEESGKKDLKELLSSMEQFYQNMAGLPDEKGMPDYFVLELAKPVGLTSVVMYAAVPKHIAGLFEKQLTAAMPKVRLEKRPGDYNMFAEQGYTTGAEAKLSKQSMFSLKTYADFTHDPLGSILSAFSRLEKDTEGAAVQFVIVPKDKRNMLRQYQRVLERIRGGISISHATSRPVFGFGKVLYDAGEFFSPPKRVQDGSFEKDPQFQNLNKKVASPIVETNIRLVASGETPTHAAAILSSLESAFKQFGDTVGNEIVFDRIGKSALVAFSRRVSFRSFDPGKTLPISTAELTGMAHLPPRSIESAPDLKASKAAIAPAPADLPTEGAILGVNKFRGEERMVRIAPEDRLRHLYVIGQTGTGKSTLLKNLIIQDIQSGAGVCMIDPHGTDVLDVLSAIPAERHKDVVYFDPGATEYPMGLNMLEYDPRYPEQKSLVVDELLGIFKKLFGAVPESMGPAFEQYFRNAALLVMDDPSSGSTLLDISRIFSDASFRNLKLARCKNPVVAQFWKGIALKAEGEQSIENYGPYVTNKFDVFVSNEIVRPIIAQQQSAFNFRHLMDERKILLVNLAKGRIGELNANLLGLIIVGKFLIAALSRADSVGKEMSPFYLHIDEFQNFTTDSIATILSEARKYKLSLTVAHQFIAQLTDSIRDAVFGNVGSMCSFRIGSDDAEKLEKQFAPVFSAQDLMNVDNRNAYLRLLIHGRPERPFNIETLPFVVGEMSVIDSLRELSYRTYGRPRAEVETEIQGRYVL